MMLPGVVYVIQNVFKQCWNEESGLFWILIVNLPIAWISDGKPYQGIINDHHKHNLNWHSSLLLKTWLQRSAWVGGNIGSPGVKLLRLLLESPIGEDTNSTSPRAAKRPLSMHLHASLPLLLPRSQIDLPRERRLRLRR